MKIKLYIYIRCTYTYDVFGNLNTKNCSDGYYQYLIDPFGMFGSDIIAEVGPEMSTFNALILTLVQLHFSGSMCLVYI